MNSEEISIGKIETDEPLILEQAPNGGWVVLQNSKDMRAAPPMIGAYSSAQDMIKALSVALLPQQ